MNTPLHIRLFAPLITAHPRALLLIFPILLLPTCAYSPQASVKHASTGAVETANFERRYGCDSGESLTASYSSSDSATVSYRGDVYSMKGAVSASGSRYLGDNREWWTKGVGPGSEGLLSLVEAGNASGARLDRCVEL